MQIGVPGVEQCIGFPSNIFCQNDALANCTRPHIQNINQAAKWLLLNHITSRLLLFGEKTYIAAFNNILFIPIISAFCVSLYLNVCGYNCISCYRRSRVAVSFSITGPKYNHLVVIINHYLQLKVKSETFYDQLMRRTRVLYQILYCYQNLDIF